MNIHEYQAKQLLSQHGVAIPPGELCRTPDEARAAAGRLRKDPKRETQNRKPFAISDP